MLVTPVPGTDRRDLREDLRTVLQGVCDLRDGVRDGLRDGPRSAHDRLLDYLGWVNDTVRQLGRQVSAADVDRLLHTRGYDILLSRLGQNTLATDQDVLNGLISAELDARCAAFDAAFKALDSQIRLWAFRAEFVVLDTSFYVEHLQKLEEIDVAPLTGSSGEPVHILVPIVVVDELDGLKRHQDRKVRWRAGYTLAVLDRIFPRRTTQAVLQEGASGRVTIEIVFDSPGHVRLPINDDEIIDRALAIEPLASRPVTLVTYDTSQSLRARTAGLREIKLTLPRQDEEEPK